MAASEKALAGLSFYIEPMVKPAKPDAKMKDLFRCENVPCGIGRGFRILIKKLIT
jgi:hypothetical protein